MLLSDIKMNRNVVESEKVYEEGCTTPSSALPEGTG
jgi:hypothetical protein